MKRVIVTGATGYIGRNFIKKLLENNCEIYAFVHEISSLWANKENVHEIVCPMECYKEISEKFIDKKIDTFYHFAWQGTAGKERTNYNWQLKNVQYVCDAAFLAKSIGCRRFIATGTITENVARQTLEKKYSAQNLIYGLSKLYAHNLLDIICRNSGLEYVWAQLSNIYGGDNSTGNLISYILNEWKHDRVPTFGSCNQPYNFTHIDDVVEALYLIGSVNNVNSEYVISNGDVRKLKDFLTELSEIYKKPIAIGKREDDGIVYEKNWFDNSRLIELGYKRIIKNLQKESM
ncbi:MAG: NAD(P)-dependent oxidoreductase [Lachnospiraceae bacterium]|nr:NAD(P)-dependent oxidoreductase [Lachnospiraceae bacterium]